MAARSQDSVELGKDTEALKNYVQKTKTKLSSGVSLLKTAPTHVTKLTLVLL